MELIEIEMVGLEANQRPFQLRASSRGIPLLRIAGEKDVVALHSLHRDPHLHLGVTIRGGDIEIVDSALMRLPERAVGVFLWHLRKGQAGVSDHGDGSAGAS